MNVELTATVRRRGLRAFVSDTLVLTRRNLLISRRTPELVVAAAVMPIMFVLLFRYVFGGSIHVAGYPHYVDYLIPGIIVQTSLFGGSSSAAGVAEDLSRGATDRFRSLPTRRGAILAARTVADLVRLTYTVTLMVAIGTAVGFRFHNGWLPSLAGIGIALFFGYACSWLFALLGLVVRNVEAATITAMALTFPLVFAASTFTAAESMPRWLRDFAEVQPVTRVVDALRALTQGTGSATQAALPALAWSAGILVVAAALATRRFRTMLLLVAVLGLGGAAAAPADGTIPRLGRGLPGVGGNVGDVLTTTCGNSPVIVLAVVVCQSELPPRTA